MTEYLLPVPLTRQHGVAEFVCASAEQTHWLHHHAMQAQSMGTAKVFVVTELGRDEVVAYYAWRMAQIEVADAPTRLSKGAGRYPQPVALLARLGVATAHERRGLGAGLLKDVLVRARALSDQVGCRALLVHAEDHAAKAFYISLIPEFADSPTEELHLVLLLKDIRKTLG